MRPRRSKLYTRSIVYAISSHVHASGRCSLSIPAASAAAAVSTHRALPPNALLLAMIRSARSRTTLSTTSSPELPLERGGSESRSRASEAQRSAAAFPADALLPQMSCSATCDVSFSSAVYASC